jgi:hypothetical protein
MMNAGNGIFIVSILENRARTCVMITQIFEKFLAQQSRSLILLNYVRTSIKVCFFLLFDNSIEIFLKVWERQNI